MKVSLVYSLFYCTVVGSVRRELTICFSERMCILVPFLGSLPGYGNFGAGND